MAGITPGSQTTLQQVATTLGSSQIWHAGDAASSDYHLCYQLRSETKLKFLDFVSSGEMASPKGQVTSVKLLETELSDEYVLHCGIPTIRKVQIHTSVGLKLGMSKTEVESHMGPPKRALQGRSS